MSIYSWSIGHILEHEFFCLGCLGWAGSKEKKVDLSFSGQLLRVFFSTFWGQKKWIFFWKHCRKFPHFFDIFDDFVYCWTFEILHLHICLLLNLWTFFTAEPLRLSVAAEPLDFLYCWTFEIMPWIMYLFTAEPLDFIYCWTFEIICLLLNLWIFFTAEPLIFFYCWTFEIMPWIMYLFVAEPLRRFSSKQNHQNFWIHLDQLNQKNKNKN